MDSRKPQLNILVSERDRWVLDLLAAARGVSLPTLLRPVVEAYLREQEQDDDVHRLISAAEQMRRHDDEGGTIQRLRPSKRTNRSDP